LKKLGKYEILGELGHGAMGIVYRARDPFINRFVALKTITTGVADDPALLERFYREAQSAGGLQHPNIVTIYDMGDEGRIPYIAMELIEGENLEQVIARRAVLSISLKLVYASQACRAFDYAHKRGIVHRDIKPGNVMLAKDGSVRVVDFGIARVLDASKTQTGMLIGTFAYMSPEQYHGEHADERSDIWSFGVLLYELLTYQRPFTGATPASLMHSICQVEPASLTTVLPDCPSDLAVIMSKILQKSPAVRYQSMEDVLLELEPVSRKLQSQAVAELVEQAGHLVEKGEFSDARDLLRQALQVESGNLRARGLLEKVNVELKRISVRPKVQECVEKGRTFLDQGKVQDAKVAADSALHLDSTFEPAQELQRVVLQEIERAKRIAEWIEAAKQHLAEGLPDEAEALVAKVLSAEPSNQQAATLQQQASREKEERLRRQQLLEGLQQARTLWTQQQYDPCIKFLSSLEKTFPGEEEVSRLLETVREDYIEQQKQQTLLESRNLLAARRHDECIVLLMSLQKQLPRDEEIPKLLEDVRKDQKNQQRLRGLTDARSALAAGQYEACIALLHSLRKEFPDEQEIPRLLETAQRNQQEQRRQAGLAEARKMLAARRYEECTNVLRNLKKHFPSDDEIVKLLENLRADEAEQRKQESLGRARTLLQSRDYEKLSEALALMQKEFPDDGEIRRLQNSAAEEQAELRKQECLGRARRLLESRDYEKLSALLGSLQREFPNEAEIERLRKSAAEEQAEQRKRERLAEARKLLAGQLYEESIAVLTGLQAEFGAEPEINKLLESARIDRAERQKQQKLAEARSHLAAQAFAEAMASVDSLADSHPNDAAVLKLRTLIEREQEKHATAERMGHELELLKKLSSEKKYAEVLSRTKELLAEFPGDTNFRRLAEFATSQKAHIDNENLFRKTLDQAKSLFNSGQFEESVVICQGGLKNFPDDPELLNLYQQGEIQVRKLQVRQQIEQRVREIRVKINREKFSEAIDLAQQTLVNLGPDTDLSQLLNSAQVEVEARGRKRKQERALETIRTFIESKDFAAADKSLVEARDGQILDTFDPRIQRLSEQIKDGKTHVEQETPAGPSSMPPSVSREYALLHPAPTAVGPVTEQASSADVLIPQAPASQPALAPQPAAPAEPSKGTISIPAIERGPIQPPIPEPRKEITRPAEVHAARIIKPPDESKAVLVPASRDAVTPAPQWRKPAVIVASVLLLGIATWAGVRSLRTKQQLSIKPVVLKTDPSPATVAPPVDPVAAQQRDFLDEADKLVAANDLDGAFRKLQQASALNGPLSEEIQKKQAVIQESLKDASLRQIRQREAVLWQAAMNRIAEGRYSQAEKEFREVLKLPAGGSHREEADSYLNKVIPQLMQQDRLLGQARQSLNQSDYSSARRTAEQLRQEGGDPRPLVAEIAKAEKARLDQLETQLNQLKRRDDDGSIQQLKALLPKFQAMSSDGSAESAQAAGDANDTSAAIGDAQSRAQRKSADAAFQQVVQRYQQAANAGDKNGLSAARSELQSVVQNGGPHVDEAQQYLADANARLTALNQPPPALIKPAVKPATPPGTALDSDGAIRAVIHRYEQAFDQRNADALRQVWPSMGSRYARYQSIFEAASSIVMRIDVERIAVSADGTTAVASGQFSQDFTPKGGKSKRVRNATTFQLSNVNGLWLISDVQ
jgi:eukaryotic-like serine/threonine-protein kinase